MGKTIRATGKMKWTRRIIIVLLLSAAFLVTKISFKPNRPQVSEIKSPSGVTKPANLDDTRILSVQVHTDQIFASTAEGLFRATKSGRKWERLPTPTTMPLGGLFARQPAGNSQIYYHTTNSTKAGPPDPPDRIEGLYRSEDSGQSWQPVNTEYQFKEVFVHPNENLYGIVVVTKTNHGMDRIHLSNDAGRTWTDISSDIPSGLGLGSIFQDPDQHDSLCFYGDGLRTYVIQASDKDNKWNEIKVWDWRRMHESSDTFFLVRYAPQGTYHTYSATLSNYFEHPFDGMTEIPALQLTTDKQAYHFKMGDTVAVQVEVSSLPSQPEVKIIDLEDSAGLWGVKRILPDGQNSISPPKAPISTPPSKPDNESLSVFRATHPVKTHLIAGARTYKRLLNLSAIADFPKAGTYQVQLYYRTDGAADRTQDEWEGSLFSPMFEVTIEELK